MFKIGDIVRRRGEEETGTILLPVFGTNTLVNGQVDGHQVQYYKVSYSEGQIRYLAPSALLKSDEPTRFNGKGTQS